MYNGKEITEFQVEGGNLFDGKYTIALDRMDPKDIIAIDVMQHHQPIRALQGSRITDDVALNVRLNSHAKNILVGKAELGGGFREKNDDHYTYIAHIDGGVFNAKHQAFATISANNNGEHLHGIYSAPLTTLHDDILSSTMPECSLLSESDYSTNKSKALSLNGIYKHSDTDQWSYQVSAMQDLTDGDISLERIHFTDEKERVHQRFIDFVNRYENVDLLLKYEQNKPHRYLMNKSVGIWDNKKPRVCNDLTSLRLNEQLSQRGLTLDNMFRLIYRWNEVNGIDTRFNFQFSNGNENMLVKQNEKSGNALTAKAIQLIGQNLYFVELRQEMLSTIRMGKWTVDPYWFGIIENNSLTAGLSSTFSDTADNKYSTSDDLHYLRARAGFGIVVQSGVERFRIRGYIPFVYSHLSVQSPFVNSNRPLFSLSPNISIERPLFSHPTLQLQWSRELQDNKVEDYIHSLIVRNSYVMTISKMTKISSTDRHHLSAKLNYANAFNLLFFSLRTDFTYLKSDIMENKVMEENGIGKYFVNQNCFTHVLSLGAEMFKTFFGKKVNINIKVNHTRFSSSQMFDGMKLPYLIYVSSLSFRGGITPLKGINMELQAHVNRSSTKNKQNGTSSISTSRTMLLGKISATLKRMSFVCNTIFVRQDRRRILFAHANLYYKTKQWNGTSEFAICLMPISSV